MTGMDETEEAQRARAAKADLAFLVLLERIVCPFQHGRLRSPALRLLKRMKLEGAIWFLANAAGAISLATQVDCLDGSLHGARAGSV